eukprot:m.292860 g.292860  ORF g.292860 m.292860 type:complete len:118 (-) comp20011_c1_seq5:257-610(-)
MLHRKFFWRMSREARLIPFSADCVDVAVNIYQKLSSTLACCAFLQPIDAFSSDDPPCQGTTLSDAKEAIVFALLGFLTVNGHVGSVPACTGASHAAVLGNITPGKNFESVMLTQRDA